MQWGMYMQCERHIYSGPYGNNVECIYTAVPGHTISCSEFFWGIFMDSLVSYLDME